MSKEQGNLKQMSVQQVEAAINHWRERRPASGQELTLGPEVNLLATVYALMIYRRVSSVDLDTLEPGVRQLLEQWRAQHPS